jgi:hypothetical protein
MVIFLVFLTVAIRSRMAVVTQKGTEGGVVGLAQESRTLAFTQRLLKQTKALSQGSTGQALLQPQTKGPVGYYRSKRASTRPSHVTFHLTWEIQVM